MRNLLLTPLRLSVGWGISPRVLGWVGVTMLVLLRITVGLHFFSEGADKVRSNGAWSAEPFFANARGPFAPHFRKVVWDYDGSLRLDRDKMMVEWALFRDRSERHFDFDEQQRTEAQRNYTKAVNQYDYVVELNRQEIEEYELGRNRLRSLENDPVRDGVASLSGQRDQIRQEWTSKIAPVMAQIDAISDNYEIAINALATPEQQDAKGTISLRLPPTGFMDTSLMDRFVPYFDTAIGICLLLGLFTPVAALAAGAFLGSVFLSRFPPETGPSSTYYQLVESMACLVLAGTGAGRFAGLDFFLHLFVRKGVGTSHNRGVSRG